METKEKAESREQILGGVALGGAGADDASLQRETRRNVKLLTVAMLAALAILAAFNSAALERYIGNFNGSVVAEEALLIAEQWNAAMDEAQLSAPRTALRQAIRDFRNLRFTEE